MSIARAELATMDFSDCITGEQLDPVTPGDVLLHDFMEPLGLSARALAREIEVPPNRVTEIINGERVITADTAIRLERRFGASAEFWMNLQTAHDLELARERIVVAL